MNWLDVLIASVVAVSFFSGLMKGFARAAIGLAATLVAIIGGIWFYGVAAHHIQPYVSSRGVASVLGFVAIFAAVMMAGALLAALVAKLFRLVGLSWLDRLMGGAFGIVRGALVAVVLVLMILAFDPEPPTEVVASSRLAPYVSGASELLSEITPYEIKSAFSRSHERVKEIWNQALRKDRPTKLPSERI